MDQETCISFSEGTVSPYLFCIIHIVHFCYQIVYIFFLWAMGSEVSRFQTWPCCIFSSPKPVKTYILVAGWNCSNFFFTTWVMWLYQLKVFTRKPYFLWLLVSLHIVLKGCLNIAPSWCGTKITVNKYHETKNKETK